MIRNWIFFFAVLGLSPALFATPERVSEIEDRFELSEAAVFPERSFAIRKWKGQFVSVLSDFEIRQAFQAIASSNLPFRYVKDCCHDRAHKMSYWLDEHGITSVKVFVFGNLRLKANPGSAVQWEFHVAPGLMNLQGQMIILDPGVSDRPLELRQWTSRFSKSNQKIRIRIGSRFTYTPGDLEMERTSWDDAEMNELVDLSLMGCKAIENRNKSRWTEGS